MPIKHNKRYNPEGKLSERTNTQIKAVIKEIIIPDLIQKGINQGYSEKEAKKLVHSILGKTNPERFQKVKRGDFDDYSDIPLKKK